jgi:hypothetical protein
VGTVSPGCVGLQAWILASATSTSCLDPRIRDLYADWDAVAAEAVERLRMDAVHTPGDRRLNDLVGELSLQDDDFRLWWRSHGVRAASGGRKRLRHPLVGPLELDWQAMALNATPGQTLVTYTAPRGTPSYDALHLLTSWASFEHVQHSGTLRA